MRQTMSVKKPVIDLGYRQRTHVIAAIKGERRRSAICNAFDADRVTPLDEFYATPDRQARSGSSTGSSMSTTATRSRRSAPAVRGGDKGQAKPSLRRLITASSARRRSTIASKGGGSPMNMPAPIMRWKSSRSATSAAPSGMSLRFPVRHAS